jgi:hypothetical protein
MSLEPKQASFFCNLGISPPFLSNLTTKHNDAPTPAYRVS